MSHTYYIIKNPLLNKFSYNMGAWRFHLEWLYSMKWLLLDSALGDEQRGCRSFCPGKEIRLG